MIVGYVPAANADSKDLLFEWRIIRILDHFSNTLSHCFSFLGALGAKWWVNKHKLESRNFEAEDIRGRLYFQPWEKSSLCLYHQRYLFDASRLWDLQKLQWSLRNNAAVELSSKSMEGKLWGTAWSKKREGGFLKDCRVNHTVCLCQLNE